MKIISQQNKIREISLTYTHHQVTLTTLMTEQEILLLIMGLFLAKTFILSNNSLKHFIKMVITF